LAQNFAISFFLPLRAEIGQYDGSLFAKVDTIAILETHFADARRIHRIDVRSVGRATIDDHYPIIDWNDPSVLVRDGIFGDTDLAF
jgi:hypothetical protein